MRCGCQAVAVPFTAGALYFRPPIAFMSLIPAYVVGRFVANVLISVVINVSQFSATVRFLS